MGNLKTIFLWTAVVLLALLAARFAWVLYEGPRSRTSPSVYEYSAAAQEVGKRFETAPLRTESPLEISSELLTAVSDSLPSSLQEKRAEQGAPEGAIAAALEFLSITATGDVAAYNHWRAAQGFVFLDAYPDDSEQFQTYMTARYEAVTGRDRPPNQTARAFYEEMFAAYPAQDDGALRPTSIAIGHAAAELQYKRVTHPDEHMGHAQLASDGLGSLYWVGGTTGSCVSFWEYDRSPQQLIDAHGAIWKARVWIAPVGAHGHIIPTCIWLTHDPDPSRGWRVTNWVVSNVGKGARVTEAYAACGVF